MFVYCIRIRICIALGYIYPRRKVNEVKKPEYIKKENEAKAQRRLQVGRDETKRALTSPPHWLLSHSKQAAKRVKRAMT